MKIIDKCEMGHIMIDCSTIDIKSTDIIANISKNGLLTLDAPVSGGVVGAVDGTLTLW